MLDVHYIAHRCCLRYLQLVAVARMRCVIGSQQITAAVVCVFVRCATALHAKLVRANRTESTSDNEDMDQLTVCVGTADHRRPTDGRTTTTVAAKRV